ncbi:glycosyl hydrolase 115 family protein [Teredinibacter purpureus]|uniref:glycosyl hydrolase 115 family protein n=1 Tax=Teredinibacter purpureus TaxID=2731756 RepID=UPI0009E2FEFC|nr:glycosyl hydrolase 115 family protein [Teredinibacter purpureus]
MHLARIRNCFAQFTLLLCAACIALTSAQALAALGDARYISEKALRGSVALVSKDTTATLYVDSNDHKGVIRATRNLQTDIKRVSGQHAVIVNTQNALGAHAVIIGTIGKSPLIDTLIAERKIDVKSTVGKWDGYHLQTVNNPLPGVERALVIAGADKRGTTYGIYDLSEQIGVSPWYYWADVPPQKKNTLYVLAKTLRQESPKIQYRGIFLNDEAPALSSWVAENHGNYTHEFYEKVFELLLRLKANFLWPAMWNNAFADDDIQNMILADEYGIVMSTSHHEPMMRADKEWNRHGVGAWEFSTNPDNLANFWQDGATRNRDYESIYTMGMRGQEDEPMSEGENIELLESVVKRQRTILADVFDDRPISDVPQVWCLYKEVQAYYEKGMRVPDDVILLWSDDNWGNIRRLPTPQERERAGGAGVYYHFDYVGGPRSYRWINSTPIAKIWEQMNLAYAFEANQIWITNVGDLKPMEYPIEFFLRMAWDPERWPHTRLKTFGELWATREFGAEYASEIEALMTGYTRHNGRRKPELMAPDTYSIEHYNEAERIDAELTDLVARAETLYKKMPEERKNAFFQLVLHPVKASAIVTQLNIAIGKNRQYAMQRRADANRYAEKAKALFAADAALKAQYHSLNDGKWNHFMNQSHIGYTNWNNPEGDQMPVTYDYAPGNYAEMSVVIEGGIHAWPDAGGHVLAFDQAGEKEHWLDLNNRGTQPFDYTLTPSENWITLSEPTGTVTASKRVFVSIDWKALPEGTSTARIQAKGPSWNRAHITVSAFKPNQKVLKNAKGFIDADGYLSIEAASVDRTKSVEGIQWEEIPTHGRTYSSMTPLPVGDRSFEDPQSAPYLEYDVTFLRTGEFEIQTLLAPSWPFVPGRGLRYAIAIGDAKPQVVDFLEGFSGTDWKWEPSVKDGIRIGKSTHTVTRAGRSKIRLYMVDPGVTLQKILVNTGGLKDSYLGPIESARR